MERRKLGAAAAAFVATVGLSTYAAVLDKSEIVHFWVAVPAGRVERPRIVEAAGARIRLRPVRVDLDRRGVLKRIVQPRVEALSTHWIVNVGGEPVRLRMQMPGVRVPVTWEVNANFGYDPATRTFTEPLMPGESIPNLAIDWVFAIPEGRAGSPGRQRCGGIVYDGGLELVDADTGRLLTVIPITIGRGLSSARPPEPSSCDFCPRKPGALSRPTGGDTPRSLPE